jgi:hypothetical protein
MWLPRFAAAYQLNSKMVLRAGYGVFYDSLNAFYIAPNQLGFSRTTTTNLTNDFGVTWLAGDPQNGISPLKDPFPVRADGTRYDQPVGAAAGLMAVAGRSFTYRDFSMKHARQQRWRLGLQRQFGTNTAVDVAYTGAYSDRVPVPLKLNPLPERYWGNGLQRNDALASDLNSNVVNPFQLSNFSDLRTSSPIVYQQMSTLAFFTSGTIPKHQLLRAFPQMPSVVNSAASLGKARSNALELSLQRRLSKGFNLYVTYTRLRARDADFFLNEFDSLPSWRETNFGAPHRLTVTSVVELPFGKGRPLLNSGIAGHLFGGFQIGLTYEYQPGPLLNFPNLFYSGNLDEIKGGPRTLDRWFNTANFERSASKAPAAFDRRVFPTRVDGVRADMTNDLGMNVRREFRLTERLKFQLQMDAVNALNRTIFEAPNTNPLSTNFGRIVSTTELSNRYIQIQGRIQF